MLGVKFDPWKVCPKLLFSSNLNLARGLIRLSFQGTKSPGKLAAREMFCPRQKSVFANICITKVPTALDPADQTQSCHFSQMCSAPYFSPSCSVTAPTKHQDIVSTEGKCGQFTHPELNSSPANTWTLLCFGISEVTF